MDAPATIHFPRFDNGKLVAEKGYYDRFPQDTVTGTVVFKDTQRDLAVVKLDKLGRLLEAGGADIRKHPGAHR